MSNSPITSVSTSYGHGGFSNGFLGESYPQQIGLNLRGHKILISRDTLSSLPESVLSVMFPHGLYASLHNAYNSKGHHGTAPPQQGDRNNDSYDGDLRNARSQVEYIWIDFDYEALCYILSTYQMINPDSVPDRITVNSPNGKMQPCDTITTTTTTTMVPQETTPDILAPTRPRDDNRQNRNRQQQQCKDSSSSTIATASKPDGNSRVHLAKHDGNESEGESVGNRSVLTGSDVSSVSTPSSVRRRHSGAVISGDDYDYGDEDIDSDDSGDDVGGGDEEEGDGANGSNSTTSTSSSAAANYAMFAANAGGAGLGHHAIYRSQQYVIVLREELDYFVIPASGKCRGNSISQHHLKFPMTKAKARSGQVLASQRSIFGPLERSIQRNMAKAAAAMAAAAAAAAAGAEAATGEDGSKQLPINTHWLQQNASVVEQQLIEMLCVSGFGRDATWGCRRIEPKRNSLTSISLVRMVESDDSSMWDANQKLLLFYKKPARKCWWDGEEIDLGTPANPVPIKLWCRRIWTLEVVMI
ncbi:hypothetical protein EV182_001261 [Spiromyces aspiralis]|uniref:Uncharacterized protein n=1 Tax=Spiromyces aspiralis TaxID=68401 RepID=A0ACC1HTC3_9FUNG|nr:hypothetical protein EV182_001261 [Spiromyces aspiralis]